MRRTIGEMNDTDLAETIYAALAARHADMVLSELASAAGEKEEAVAQALAVLEREGRAVSLPGGAFLSDAAWKRVHETARRVLAAFHKKNPFLTYAPLDTLSAPLAKAASVRDFGALVARFAEQNVFVVSETGEKARLPEHEVVMPQGWRTAAREIAAVYQSAGLTPPDPANFQAHYPRDVSVRTILQILAETGELAPLAENLYVHADAVVHTKKIVRRLAAQIPGEVTPAAVRDATSSSRKIILPLLEYLDAVGFTKRRGDVRTLTFPEKPPA